MRFSSKTLKDFISSLFHFITEDIWKLDFRKLSPIRAFFLKQARIVLIVIRKFSYDRLSVRASALVYATLLSIVPLLAVMFSLLKGFGYHNEKAPSQPELAVYLKVPQPSVDSILKILMDLGLVNVVGGRGARYSPAGCLETMSLQDIAQKLRRYGVTDHGDESDDAISKLVAEIQHQFYRPLKETGKDATLRDLIAEIDP